jgi:hypothetical protein
MNPKMRRNFTGEFSAQDCGKGVWRLTRGAPHKIEVIVRGADQGAAHAFGTAFISDLGIEWHSDMALLSFMAAERVETVESVCVIVHEPLLDLYEALPLASFDLKARKFWRRVFGLVRIPGGRFLLKFLARSS